MKTVFRVVLPLLAVSLAELGCDSSGGVTSPSGAPMAGATIQGTVNAGAAASAADVATSSVSGTNLRVTVSGTSLSTTTDASGRFTLTGVPSGSVTLRFQGTGVDATLRIDGLAEGQVLTITVEVDGSRAALSAPSGQQTLELEGLIESISAPRLRVSGRSVTTDAGTSFKRVRSLAELRVGDRVHVKGTLQSDGSILAREVMLQGPKGGEDDDAEVEGRIDSISPPNLQVAGRTVRTTAATRIERGKKLVTLADLKVGEHVDVKGVRQSDGSILASSIEVGD